MLVTVYSQQYKLDEVRWGPRKHFLLFKSRPAVYHAYFTVPHDLIHDQQNPLTTYCMHQNLQERGDRFQSVLKMNNTNYSFTLISMPPMPPRPLNCMQCLYTGLPVVANNKKYLLATNGFMWSSCKTVHFQDRMDCKIRT